MVGRRGGRELQTILERENDSYCVGTSSLGMCSFILKRDGEHVSMNVCKRYEQMVSYTNEVVHYSRIDALANSNAIISN